MSVIWSGITEQGAIVPVQVDASGKVIATAGVPDIYVERSGDTMTGPLVLPGNPTLDLQAATKKYVDSRTPSNELLAFGTFFSNEGAFNSKNISSVRSKGDGIYEFYFTEIPFSAGYAVITTSNSLNVVTRPVEINQFYFSVSGTYSATGAPAPSYGMSFVCYQVETSNFLAIS